MNNALKLYHKYGDMSDMEPEKASELYNNLIDIIESKNLGSFNKKDYKDFEKLINDKQYFKNYMKTGKMGKYNIKSYVAYVFYELYVIYEIPYIKHMITKNEWFKTNYLDKISNFMT